MKKIISPLTLRLIKKDASNNYTHCYNCGAELTKSFEKGTGVCGNCVVNH